MITIIGSGLAGYTLVREIRKLDTSVDIVLITQDDGNYYSKPQLSAAFTHHKTPQSLVMIAAEKFAKQYNLSLQTHTTVEKLSTHYSSKNKLVLAVGAKPILLPEFSNFPQKIFQVNNLADYRNFRETLEKRSSKFVTIIGSGLVGCEFANDLHQGGFSVRLIAPESYPLARLVPEAVGAELHQTFSTLGIQCEFSQFFEAHHPEKYSESLILSAVGLQPDLTLALSEGLQTNKGIVVDHTLRTSKENIYAIGDCVEFEGKVMPYVGPLAIGARALAKTLLGESTRVEYPPIPVYVKTSCYPVVSLLPEDPANGEWRVETEKNIDKNTRSIRALFYNTDNGLKGFALGGNFASEANEWSAKLSSEKNNN